MELELNQPSIAPFAPGKDLKVVVACEDSAAAQQVCELLARIGHNSGPEGRLIYSWWNFDVLAIAQLRTLAAEEAAAAGMIIIAARERPNLPVGVVDWIKRWLDLRQERGGALVAVLDSDRTKPEVSEGILLQLKKSAALGQMDFFVTRAKEARAEERRTGRNMPGTPGNLSKRMIINTCATRIAGRRGSIPTELFDTYQQDKTEK